MELKEVIKKRRALRSIGTFDVSKDLIEELADDIKLAPSCFNNQPWNFIFVYEKEALKNLYPVLIGGNKWAEESGMIIVVISKKEDDCVIKSREYYQFDTGMATAYLLLLLVEKGLVGHPMAGFSPSKTRKALGIPKDYDVITLIAVGKELSEINPDLSDEHKETEKERPERKSNDSFIYHNTFSDNE